MAITASQTYMRRDAITVVDITDTFNDATGMIEIAGSDRSDLAGVISYDTNNPAEAYQVLSGVILVPDPSDPSITIAKRFFDMRTRYAMLRTDLDHVHARLSGAEYWETWHPVEIVDSALTVSLKSDHQWHFTTVTGATFNKAAGERLLVTMYGLRPVTP